VSYLNLHFKRVLPLKGYRGAGRRNGTEQSRSTKEALEAHEEQENPFRAEADGRGWLVDPKENHRHLQSRAFDKDGKK